MFNEFKSLLWLRWRYLLATKVILFVCVLTPFLDFYLLSLWEVARQDTYFLNMALSMIYSLTAGCFITMMVGEEKKTISKLYACQVFGTVCICYL